MEDVALTHGWTPFGEMMHPLSTLDVENFEDDVTHVMIMMMMGPTPSLGHPWMVI